MNVGDRVVHKLCGLLMTVTKLSDEVAVCMRDVPEPPDKYNQEPVYTAICAVENLEVIQEKQLTLF
jgi:hypothetical protein